MKSNKELDQTHFKMAAEQIDRWSKWRQDLVYPNRKNVQVVTIKESDLEWLVYNSLMGDKPCITMSKGMELLS